MMTNEGSINKQIRYVKTHDEHADTAEYSRRRNKKASMYIASQEKHRGSFFL